MIGKTIYVKHAMLDWTGNSREFWRKGFIEHVTHFSLVVVFEDNGEAKEIRKYVPGDPHTYDIVE